MLSATPALAAIELSTGTELAYVGGLVLSGVILLVLAATGFGLKSTGVRVLNAVIGLAMIGYAGYILFLTEPGDTIIILWYVFIIPILLIINVVKAAFAKSSTS